jgi:hypothetical protein
MKPWSSYREAESSLLERRRAQRGTPTLGDDVDRALMAALAALPSDARALARESGQRLGADVYSSRYAEETLTQGLALLAEGLHDSGVGDLHLEDAFHRTARVSYEPGPVLIPADPNVRSAFLEGVIAGFLSSAYNCDAHAHATDDSHLDVALGEGRDVNRHHLEGP